MLIFDVDQWERDKAAGNAKLARQPATLAKVATLGPNPYRKTIKRSRLASVASTQAKNEKLSLPPKLTLSKWQSALAKLHVDQPIEGNDPTRWLHLCDTSFWWLDHFGDQAASDGWTTADVFGLSPQGEGWGGLIDRLGTSRSLIMEGPRAHWRSDGVVMRFNRGAYPELVAFWEES